MGSNVVTLGVTFRSLDDVLLRSLVGPCDARLGAPTPTWRSTSSAETTSSSKLAAAPAQLWPLDRLARGQVERLKLHYRVLLEDQAFVVIYSAPSKLALEGG
jgi:hypothetical protein